MVTTNKDCYLQGYCKKYANGDTSCQNGLICQYLRKVDYLYEASMIPKVYYEDFKALGTCDNDKYAWLADYEKHIAEHVKVGHSVYIYSEFCGNGKTSWAIRLLKSYLRSCWASSDLCCRALFIDVPKFLIELKNSISKKSDYVDYILENVMNADLVVWDEIANKSATEFEQQRLFEFINDRINNGKCNIYTSNTTPDQLKDAVGQRLYSRICNPAMKVPFYSTDKREVSVR